jgi:sugar phosphate isomerase/epimerase
MPKIQLCLFAAEPDIAALNFIVKVLTGTLDEIASRAVAWNFDGIEFMPNPDHVADPSAVARALKAAGAAMPVVNSGRMAVQGYALIHREDAVRRQSAAAYKRLLDFAGHFGARVGLGAARGMGVPNPDAGDLDGIVGEVFDDLARHAAKCGAVIMLEPADPGTISCINTVEEAMAWVDRIGNPAFSVMLDTYQLIECEVSIKHGIRAARGQARHIRCTTQAAGLPAFSKRAAAWTGLTSCACSARKVSQAPARLWSRPRAMLKPRRENPRRSCAG